MPLPKRIYLENYPYFIVFNTYHRIPLFTSEICCDIVIDNLKFYRNKHNFKLLGFAIMPCHFLGIFLPKKPREISRIISDIKNYSRNQILKKVKRDEIKDYYYPCGKKCFCELYPESQARCNSAVTRTKREPQLRRGSAVTRISRTKDHKARNIGVPPPMSPEDTQFWQPNSSLRELLVSNTIWQRRFWDHVIRNDQDFEEKFNYVNYNAIKHGLVSDPVDYRYSSTRNYYLNDHSIIKIDQIS